MNVNRIRVLGAGFTEEEYKLYRLGDEAVRGFAANFLSNRLNNATFRPRVNNSAQKHVLEDKWVAQLYFAALGLPVAPVLGLWHSCFGITSGGMPMRTSEATARVIERDRPLRLVFKPRGGRQGRHIHVVQLEYAGELLQTVVHRGRASSLDDFLSGLPDDAFKDYDGGYHGWLVQHYVRQHPFMLELAPYAVNTFRVITFVNADGTAKVQMAALRLGRKESVADNWDKGGISVGVDIQTGRLGRGVFKPSYGGQWVTAHPDSGAVLEGQVVPNWSDVVAVCTRAASALTGVRSIGWDIALSVDGPVILEGNADWSLPLVQVHSTGYLSSAVRADLAACGARFPEHLPALLPALARHIWLQMGRSRMGRLANRRAAHR